MSERIKRRIEVGCKNQHSVMRRCAQIWTSAPGNLFFTNFALEPRHLENLSEHVCLSVCLSVCQTFLLSVSKLFCILYYLLIFTALH